MQFSQIGFLKNGDTEEFLNRVMAPLVSVSSTIKFLDSLAGKKLTKDNNNPEQKETFYLSPNFIQGLQSLLQIIEEARQLTNKKNITFMLVTTKPKRKDIGAGLDEMALLNLWKDQIVNSAAKQYPNINLEIVYINSWSGDFHQRYILSDVVDISIEKGLDFSNKSSLENAEVNIVHALGVKKIVKVLTDRISAKRLSPARGRGTVHGGRLGTRTR